MAGNTQSNHSSSFTALTAWSTAALFCFGLGAIKGQSPTFVASIEPKEVIVGVPFELSFTLANAEGQRFTPPSLRDFQASGGVSESRGMSIINGKANSKQAWIFTLVATRPGVFSIGSASVSIGARVFNSAPLTIKVLSPAVASKGTVGIPPGADDQVFIVGSLNTQKAFPGQQLTWRLTLFTRVAIEGADLISLPSFDGFYSKEKRHFDTGTQYQTIRGKKYAVKILHEESLFPQSTGELTINPAQIRVGLDQPGAQGFLFGTKPVTLTTQAVKLNVQPLPEPVPERFTGGVGRYEWEVRADTNTLSTDDALTLTVTLKGNGDSRRFAPPKMVVPPTCEIFEPRILEEAENENELEIVHVKRLEYIILPKEPGIQSFVPELIYFNIDSNRYCTLQSAPIRFEVTAGQNYHATSLVDTIATPITTVQPSLLNKIGAFFASPVIWGGLLMSVSAFGLFLVFRKRKSTAPTRLRNNQPDPVLAAHQRFVAVGTLIHSTAPPIFYNELLKSLQSYIAARLNLSPAQMNQPVLKVKMAERNITPIRIQAFLSILQTCEQAVFSGHSDVSSMASDWHAAEVVVQELEKEMR